MKLLVAALMASVHLAGQAPATDGLLADAAADFKAHTPHPADVRNVHPGVLRDGGKTMPIVCGQFLPEGENAQWTDFSTIKTSGYEQALGWQATALCGKAQLDANSDLTLTLKSKLDVK